MFLEWNTDFGLDNLIYIKFAYAFYICLKDLMVLFWD